MANQGVQNATFDENPHENERINVILGCAIGLIACAKHRCMGGWLKLCLGVQAKRPMSNQLSSTASFAALRIHCPTPVLSALTHRFPRINELHLDRIKALKSKVGWVLRTFRASDPRTNFNPVNTLETTDAARPWLLLPAVEPRKERGNPGHWSDIQMLPVENSWNNPN